MNDAIDPTQDARPQPSALSRDLSRFEFTFITLFFGFLRWVENCMEASGVRGLHALDILVLHAVNHRARRRRLSEVAMVLNIGDTHLVSYSLKKLVAAGLVEVRREGRHRLYETTPSGDAACMGYRRTREHHLIGTLEQLMSDGGDLTKAGNFLRLLTGVYDQAGRFATADSLEQPLLPPVRTK